MRRAVYSACMKAGMQSKHYEKLADWGERFALLVFGSLVIQQFVGDRMSGLILAMGVVASAGAYTFAYWALKKS